MPTESTYPVYPFPVNSTFKRLVRVFCQNLSTLDRWPLRLLIQSNLNVAVWNKESAVEAMPDALRYEQVAEKGIETVALPPADTDQGDSSVGKGSKTPPAENLPLISLLVTPTASL